MLGVPDEANVWVFANQRVSNVFSRPLHCEFYEIAKLSDCLVCQQPRVAGDAEVERILQQLHER